MADITAYTHKFRATGEAYQQHASAKVTKRNRQPLSCVPCRTRKLKCDRGHPCETCVKRNDEPSCSYGKTPPNQTDGGSRVKAQERLKQLEQLVMQMVTPGTGSDKNATSTVPKPPQSAQDDVFTAQDGFLQTGTVNQAYAGSTHWSAILENIQELKTVIRDEATPPSDLDDVEDAPSAEEEVLFGVHKGFTIQQVLSRYLPPKEQVNRRLSTYFNAKYMVIPLLHTQRFLREYEKFWEDPLNSPPLWISLLFSICCMSAGLSEAVGSEPSTPEDQPSPKAFFLTAAAKCLVLGGFTRPKKYVVEALCLYAQCKYMTSLDPSAEVAVVFGVAVRLIFRMGYHRDPDNYPQFSPFEGEMRRRVWAMCRQFDLMISFQMGLPNCIPTDCWDTKLPRNLLDSDFDEDSTELPPSRPESEPTQILYFIVKSRLMTGFGKICNLAMTFKSRTQAEIMALDAEIRQIHSTIPVILRIKPMSQSFADPVYIIMVRLNSEFLYQKSICVLHRKYMTLGYEYSTKACIEAAMAITRHLNDMYKEFQPGGFLHNDRWMLTSFTMNDFLLAAMVLCLALSMWRKQNPGRNVRDDPAASEQLDMLRKSYAICAEKSLLSVESKRVANALKIVLARFEPDSDTSLPDHMPPPTQTNGDLNHSMLNNTPSSTLSSNLLDVNLTPLSLSETQLPSTQPSDPSIYTPNDSINAPSTLDMDLDLGPFENLLDGSDYVDWTLLDQFLVNSRGYDEASTGLTQGDWISAPQRFLGGEQRPNRVPLGSIAFPSDGAGVWPQY